PALHIYRPDLVPADCTVDRAPRPDLAAVLLSHAHLDHAGCIGYLDTSVPVVASPVTIAILKGIQDTGSSSAETDIVYSASRTRDGGDRGLLLRSDRSSPYRGRTFYATGPVREELLAFLAGRPGQKARGARKYEPGGCAHTPCDLPFRIYAHPVDHSIYGAVGFLLEGDTTLAYTGDFRLHGKNGRLTSDFVSRARDASVLITEGTRAGRSGEVSEAEVAETCRAAVEESAGLVIADFSARNFERLESFAGIADATGRRLVITARDAYMLHTLRCADGIDRLTPDIAIYRELTDHTRRRWEGEVVEAQAADRYVEHTEIHDDPGSYLLCFSYFDVKHLLDIKPEGGTYLYSACEAFTEEMAIDFQRLATWLEFFGMASSGFTCDASGLSFDPCFHASGHAPADDLAEVIDRIDPDVLIPVHTLDPGWFSERWDAAVIVADGERREF
ncbi:MAG: MBL fold metallo-hydrolase, partial [Methanomicrobiaceae archaeon]|nr:MBL fold metallo-hydrolase [Methanomicrobiaceae archaeon]